MSVAVSSSPALANIEAAGLSAEEARRLIREAVGVGLGELAKESDARVTVIFVHVLADAAPSVPGKVEIGVEVELTGEQIEGVRREPSQFTDRVDPVEGVVPALRRALIGAVRRGAEGLTIAQKAERKSDDELVRDLKAIDPRLRDYAIRVLADRRNPSVVPALIERLQDEDEDVVERAVGALAQIRDPRAIAPLIDLSQHRDPAIVAQLARIVGDIGGHDAEAYLTTLASGHPEPVVRKAADAALAEMRTRHAARRSE